MSNQNKKIARLDDDRQSPFIIAEMSGNHNHSLERALEIVRMAAAAGAHALKLQSFTPDSMTLNLPDHPDFKSNPDSVWKGAPLYQLYAEAQTPWEWHKPIFELCNELGMIGFSSPFDKTAVDFLEDLNVPLYKISSFENIDIPLIENVASTGKPVIISCGMATLAEIDDAVTAARDSGCKQLVLLKCTSAYPASPADINLSAIPYLRDMFKCQVGLSDHTMGIGVSVAATALGATVIEKHFTLDRNDGGIDSSFSMEPDELKQLVIETEKAYQAIGTPQFGPSAGDAGARARRRSLYITKDVKAGDVLTIENVKAIRPGLGLAPKYLSTVLGMKVTQDIKPGTPLSWELMK